MDINLKESLIKKEDKKNDHHDHDHDHKDHDHDHDHKDHDHDHKGHDHQDHSRRDSHAKEEEDMENVNVRAAFIHVVGDIVQSIGVIIAAVIIKFRPDLVIVDPICTILFSIIVVFTTVPIICDCMRILMEGTPANINVNRLTEDLLKVPGVEQVHDLHVWGLSVGKSSMSAHLISSTPMVTLKKATRLLNTKYKILHTTIQIEHAEKSGSYQCKSELHD